MYEDIQTLNKNIKIIQMIHYLLKKEQKIDAIIILKIGFIIRRKYVMEKKDIIIKLEDVMMKY